MRMDYRTLLASGFAVGTVVGGVAAWLGIPPAQQTFTGDQRTQVAPGFAEDQAVEVIGEAASPEDSEPEDYYKSLEEARQTWLLAGSLTGLVELAQRWAAEAPEEAFDAFVRLFEGEDGFDESARRGLFMTIIRPWGRKDLDAALAGAGRVKELGIRSALITTALAGLADADAAAAFARIEASPEFQNPDFYGNVFSTWGREDPEAAQRSLAAIENPALRREAMLNMTSGWTQHDMMGALGWASTLTDARLRDEVLARIVSAAGGSWLDPEAGVQALEIMDNGPGRIQAAESFAESILPRWAKENPQGAMDWVSDYAAMCLENGSSASLTSKVVDAWVDLDPETALAWAATLPGESGEGVYRGAFSQWVEAAPAQAASYAGGLKVSRDRQTLYRTLTKGWVQHDPAALESWLSGISPGPERDAAVEGLIEFYAAENPEAAAAWTATLSEESSRKAWMENLRHDDGS